MDYGALVRFVQFACGAILFYGLYKWWKQGAKDRAPIKADYYIRIAKAWIIIGGLALIALYHLARAIF